MYKFEIKKNEVLSKSVAGYYNTKYLGWGEPGNPDYLNNIKNLYAKNNNELTNAVNTLTSVLEEDLELIAEEMCLNELVVCVVPRAKILSRYHENQLYFRKVVRLAINNINGLIDGVDYIMRHTDTRTTHLKKYNPVFINDGLLPYKGIARDTCNISKNVYGKDILLIDDIYTKTVNIDEDFIQCLLDNGAKTVTFYAVAKTYHYSTGE